MDTQSALNIMRLDDIVYAIAIAIGCVKKYPIKLKVKRLKVSTFIYTATYRDPLASSDSWWWRGR